MSELEKFYQEYWEYYLKSSPTLATFLGYHQYDDKMPDLSEEHHFTQLDEIAALLSRLEKIEPKDEAGRINHEILSLTLKQNLETKEFYSHLLPINPMTGFHITMPQIIDIHPFKTETDLKNYFLRLKGFRTLIDQAIQLMEKGISKGVVIPKVLIEKCIPQIKGLLPENPEENVFYLPLKKLTGFSEEETKKFQSEGLQLVEDYVIASYQKLLSFVEDTYLLAGKEEVGLWSLPNGKAEYEYWVRYHTTTTLTAKEIHEIGKAELDDIRQKMDKIRTDLGFEGDLKAFMKSLRENPDFHYETEEELLQGFRDILKVMDTKLPQLFKQLPKTPYDLKPIEEYRAKAAPMAYYYPPAMDGSRAGYFFVNTTDLETRSKYHMEVLAYHEAVPGHHLQIALAQEMDMPEFRRMATFTGYVEGWGLYSEVLPKEVGLYQDPYSEFGRLIFDAWRAARLVIDTGIHAFKWTREQAIEFGLEHTGLTEKEIVSEVDRYIAYPGQALSYKIGQRKILELRKKAEEHFGDKFEIKEFHQKVLENGSLPLSLLEKFFQEWLDSSKAA